MIIERKLAYKWIIEKRKAKFILVTCEWVRMKEYYLLTIFTDFPKSEVILR